MRKLSRTLSGTAGADVVTVAQQSAAAIARTVLVIRLSDQKSPFEPSPMLTSLPLVIGSSMLWSRFTGAVLISPSDASTPPCPSSPLSSSS
jgi:hypothetical protein